MQLFFIVISYPFINHVITFEECKSTGTSFKSNPFFIMISLSFFSIITK